MGDGIILASRGFVPTKAVAGRLTVEDESAFTLFAMLLSGQL